jgi:ABC-2 type transport system permease protein
MVDRLQIGLNPILVKELRSRMRDSRAFITLTLVLLLLGGISYLLYRIMIAATAYSMMPVSPQIGQSLFIALVFMLLVMVSAIAPAVTAGAISSEKEKLTYEMLLVTPLKAGSILWGKLISALIYVFLLIFAAIPMASLIFIFGGVTLWDMLKALVILVSVAIMFGMLGMFMSSLLGRTPLATVMSYLIVASLYIGPLITFIAVGVINQAEPPRWLLIPSPMSAIFSAITAPANIGYMGGMDFLWSISMLLGGNINALTGSRIGFDGIPRPLYQYSLPLFAFFTLILYFLSSRLVMPTRRWKLSRRDVLAGVGVILLLSAVVGAFYLSTSGRYEGAGSLAANPNFQVMEPALPRPVERLEVAREIPIPDPVEKVAGPYPAPHNGEEFYNETVDIYSNAVRRILEENLWEGRLLYLVNATSLGTDGHEDGYIDLEELDVEVREGVRMALLDLPINEIVWMRLGKETELSHLLLDTSHAVIVVDDIIYINDKNAEVLVSFHNQKSSSEKTISLTRIDGNWTVK